MDRGIVTNSRVVDVIKDGFQAGRILSDQEVRYFSLYWDKIAIPQNNYVGLGLGNEMLVELEELGIVTQPKIQLTGELDSGQLGKILQNMPCIATQALSINDFSTNWTLHQLGSQLHFPNQFMDLKRVLRLKLVNLLPVPNGDIPITEILEFKHQRADELNALHSRIDDIYIEALANPDQILGGNRAIHAFTQDVKNLNEVSEEKWFDLSRYNFSVDFNFDAENVQIGVVRGGAFDALTGGFTFPFGAIVGGAQACFNIQASRKFTFNNTVNSTKLAFLSDADTEGII